MDAAADKFSTAEDALFGAKTKPAVAEAPAVPASHAPSSMGRILRDLHEPAPPPLPEPPPPARRGRKPGSKNKPKAFAAPPAASAPSKVRPAWADAVAAKHTNLHAPTVSASPAPSGAPAQEIARSTIAGDETSQRRRTRLRDRSSILKRYVLGTEPAPGQPGWVRGLRSKRRG